MSELNGIQLRAVLAAAADPDDAAPMARYMRDQFPFLGLKTPARRAATRGLLRQSRKWEIDRVVAGVDHCWSEPEREFQYVGTDLVVGNADRLPLEHLDDLRRWVTTASWWDTVDALAAHGVGRIVALNPAGASIMDEWITDDDVWIARTAILHQLRFAAATDAARLFGYVLLRAGDDDFFIRKASGWALRSYAKVEPDRVEEFVADHHDELSGLTRREALKHL